VLLCAAALLGGRALARPESPPAAAPTTISFADLPIADDPDPRAAAERIARAYSKERVALRISVDRGAELGRASTVGDAPAGSTRSSEPGKDAVSVRPAPPTEWVHTRSELGAVVDLDHLTALVAEARDPGSPLRLAHERIRGAGTPLRLPMPVTLDTPRAVALLVAIKDATDRRPSDARLDLRTRRVIPETSGRRLDVYGTLERLARALRDGSRYVDLVVETRAPRRTTREVAGIDVRELLGWFETRYNPGEKTRDRTFNLRVAAAKVDGLVLMPGETFDFNDVVGPRSEANGFRVATVIAGGELGEGVGGGTCQIAGTLHAAAYFAGLPISTRQPHSRPSYYIRMGMDAMVSYPNVNLRFRNDLPFPIALGMSVGGGIVRAEVRGARRTRMVTFVRRIDGVEPFDEIERPDPTLPSGVRVLEQRGVPGFRITRFRVVRDVLHNQAVRQRSEDRYPPTRQIWRVGTGGAPPPGFVPPAGDDHEEYRADEYLAVTQGPGIDGLQEQKRTGRTGTPGWTVREGFARPR
jgi:vancomycin resistance protein YoaR